MAPLPKLNQTAAPAAPVANDNVEGAPAWNLRYIGDRPRERPSYLIKGILPLKGVGLLAGQSRAGKTFLGIDMTLSIVYGCEFLGRKTRFGAALWFAPEGAGEIEDRVFAARRERFGDDSDSPIPFIWGENIAGTTVDDVCKEIEAQIAVVKGECGVSDGMWPKHPLRVVVVDTLIAGFPIDDENNNAECGKLMKRLAMIGNAKDVLILVVTHFGKAAGTGVRGASALTAGADVILTCSASIDDTTGTVAGKRSLALAKSRRGGTGPLTQFKIASTIIGYDEDRDPVTAGYVEFLERVEEETPQRVAKAKSKVPRDFTEALNEALASHAKSYTIPEGPTVKAVNVIEVRNLFLRRYITGNPETSQSARYKAFSRALSAAKNESMIAGVSLSTNVELIWQPHD